MSAMDWFSQLSPEMQAALVQGGFGLAGGALTGAGEEGRQNSQNAANADISRMNNLTDLARNTSSAQQTAVNSLGSPLKFARERAGMAFLGDMLGSGGGGTSQQVFAPPNIAPYQGKVGSGGLGNTAFGSAAKQFLTPGAMANAEVPYWQAMAALNPDVNPNLGASGYGDAANTPGSGSISAQSPTAMIDAVRQKQGGIQDQQRTALNNALMPGSNAGGTPIRPPAPNGYEYDKNGNLKKKGHGFWGTLGKIGLIAGGALATPFVGPLGAAMIGAGVGAGTGAIDNGWKGALSGAALGGLTAGMSGGIGGAAGTAAGRSVGQIGKSLLTNPQFLMNSTGQVLGGKTGTALQLGSMAAPQGFTANQRGLQSILRQAHQPIKGPLQGTGIDETMGDAAGAGMYPGAANPTGSARYAPMIQQILKGALGGQAGPMPTYGGVPATAQPGSGLVDTPQQRAQAQAQMQQMIQQIMALLQGSSGGGQQYQPQNPFGYGGFGSPSYGGGASTPPFQLYPQVQR